MAWHDANIEPVEPAAVFNHDVITDAKPSCLGKGRVDRSNQCRPPALGNSMGAD
jgi:hypothetical protein